MSEYTEKLFELYKEKGSPCKEIRANIFNVSLIDDIFLENGINDEMNDKRKYIFK